MFDGNTLQNISEKAQLVSALMHSLRFSWLEIEGCDIEILLEAVSGLADDVTAHLINEECEVPLA